MKLLALMLVPAMLVGCEAPSKIDGQASGAPSKSGGGGGGGAGQARVIEKLRAVEERLAAFEGLHKPSSDPNLSLAERFHRIEVSLALREESLGFLEMAHAQQKRQEEMKEAQEMDPAGMYGVDISKALAAGQVEGVNSAIVTVVEAWDFA